MKRQLPYLIADQGVSAFTTFALSVYAARNASVVEFGVFAVAYALFWIVLGLTRSYGGEVSMIMDKSKLDEMECWRAYNTTSSLFSGLIAALVVLVGCLLITPAQAPWTALAFAAATPFAIAADAVRYVEFVGETPRHALTLDLAWLCTTLLAPPAFSAMGVPYVSSAVLGWGLGAAIGFGLALMTRPDLRPRFRGTLTWLAGRRLVGAQYAADFMVGNGIGQAATAFLPVITSLAVAGGLRAGYVIAGPLNVALSAMILFLIPRMRSALESRRVLPAPALSVWISFAIFCCFCAAIVVFFPEKLGQLLFGQSWSAGQTAAPLLIAGFAFMALVQILVQVLRLRGFPWLAVRVRLFVSVIQAAALVVGAVFFGVIGAAGGVAFSAFLSVGIWWLASNIAGRKADRNSE